MFIIKGKAQGDAGICLHLVDGSEWCFLYFTGSQNSEIRSSDCRSDLASELLCDLGKISSNNWRTGFFHIFKIWHTLRPSESLNSFQCAVKIPKFLLEELCNSQNLRLGNTGPRGSCSKTQLHLTCTMAKISMIPLIAVLEEMHTIV
jgi:hypothetical protein